MLAFHYSMGEDEEKAVEYLIKAGEVALRSSGSSEALHFYQEALKLYIKKYGDDSDPTKLAMLEKNIALAFFNKGQHINALEFFDSVFERWGVKSSKNKIFTAFRLVSDLLSLLANLYIPSGKAKKAPDKNTDEFFDLHYKRAILLVYVDPTRSFVEFLRGLRKLNRYNITEIENGVGLWMSSCLVFSWAGISYSISKKALEYAKDIIDKNNVKELLYYNFFHLLYNFFIGNWDNIEKYDENLVDLNLNIGEFWLASTYIVFQGFFRIEKGELEEAQRVIDMLSEIWKVYANEDAREYQSSLSIKLLLECRKLADGKEKVDAAILAEKKAGRELAVFYYLGFRAIIQIWSKEIDGAKDALSQAKELLAKIGTVPPLYIGTYLMGQFLYDLHLLENALFSNNSSGISKYRRKARKSGKRALRNSGKYRPDRVEVFKLIGRYYWLVGRQGKAVKWWGKSIKFGEQTGARIQLARTYMEIGTRLLEEKSRFSELGGSTSVELLGKARALFEEMGLQWDLDELDRIAAYC